jgi:hypothetical protein
MSSGPITAWWNITPTGPPSRTCAAKRASSSSGDKRATSKWTGSSGSSEAVLGEAADQLEQALVLPAGVVVAEEDVDRLTAFVERK